MDCDAGLGAFLLRESHEGNPAVDVVDFVPRPAVSGRGQFRFCAFFVKGLADPAVGPEDLYETVRAPREGLHLDVLVRCGAPPRYPSLLEKAFLMRMLAS